MKPDTLTGRDAAAVEPSAVMGSATEELMVCRLFSGASRIRTLGPTAQGRTNHRAPRQMGALERILGMRNDAAATRSLSTRWSVS
jgi:hypothetical protein